MSEYGTDENSKQSNPGDEQEEKSNEKAPESDPETTETEKSGDGNQ